MGEVEGKLKERSNSSMSCYSFLRLCASIYIATLKCLTLILPKTTSKSWAVLVSISGQRYHFFCRWILNVSQWNERTRRFRRSVRIVSYHRSTWLMNSFAFGNCICIAPLLASGKMDSSTVTLVGRESRNATLLRAYPYQVVQKTLE